MLGEGALHAPGGPLRAVSVDPADAPRVLELACRLGALQVWVGPAAARRLRMPAELRPPREREDDAYAWGRPHPWVDAMTAAGWQVATDPPGLNAWLRLRRQEQRVDLVFPAWDERNPFREARQVNELLAALQLFARHVGVRYRRSPGATGTALMRLTRTFRDDLASPPPPALGLDSEEAGLWLDQRAVESRPDAFVHAFDLNGMYLAACSSIVLGAGPPAHHQGAPDLLRDSWPAYWRARIGPWEGLRLPFRADGQAHWYATPAIQLAAGLGLQVDVLEAWVYPERRRALAGWYERLRDARRALMALRGSQAADAGALALGAVKATYKQALGWLGGRWLDVDDGRFRPDWRDFVISRARANLFRHLQGIEKASGERPVALMADAVLYCSPEPDPRVTAAQLGLELSDALGKFKVIGTMPAATFLSHSKGSKGAGRVLDRVLKAMA